MDLYLIGETTSFWLDPSKWLAMLKVAAGLGTLIFVHEMGHFLVAKACGVKCEKFYIGFDFFDVKIGKFVIIPRALVKFQWGETEYGVGIIPLGGYVKMLGQDDNPANAEAEAERTRIRKDDTDTDGSASEVNSEAKQDDAVASEETIEIDPRSYTAKSVPQRMAIISAGVIMNLIFAVIFGTFAYKNGVDYSPCEIGDVVAGGPAWKAGVRPGDKIIRLGEQGKSRKSEHLRFMWDLRNAVGMAGDQNDLHLLVRRTNGDEEEITVRPRLVSFGPHEMPSIGILGASETTLSPDVAYKHSPVSDLDQFKPNDKIVAVAGPAGRENVTDQFHLRAILARWAGDELTFTVERNVAEKKAPPDMQTVDITVKPNIIKRLGLVMQSGPIIGVLPGSPADRAGMRPGDTITTIDGKPFGDPMSLPHLMRSFYSQQQEIVIEITRENDQGSNQVVPLKVTPQAPAEFLDRTSLGTAPYLSVPSLGVVIPVSGTVLKVLPDSPAAQQGLQAGDIIVEMQYLTTDEAKNSQDELFNSGKPTELDDYAFTWPLIHSWLQRHDPDTKIKLFYQRGTEKGSAEMTPVATTEWNPDRGFLFTGNSAVRTAQTWPEAASLGLRQTKEDAMKILGFLRKLATGGIPITNLGGPGMIAVLATSEASQSTSRLLMFLVLISANLAVVNFLPIPVLDGGHMLFLIAEGVRGKPVSEKLQMSLTVAGLAFVGCLMLFVIGLDVWHLSGMSG